MSDQPSPTFQLIVSERILNQIKEWIQAALLSRRQAAFRADLEAVKQYLTTRPLEWGDPLYRLTVMNLLIHHGMSQFLNVHYGVDEERRIVYFKDVELMPKVKFG